jgi:hypothetical protein
MELSLNQAGVNEGQESPLKPLVSLGSFTHTDVGGPQRVLIHRSGATPRADGRAIRTGGDAENRRPRAPCNICLGV